MESTIAKIIEFKGEDFLPLLCRISTLPEQEGMTHFIPAMICSDRGKIRVFFWVKKIKENHFQILCFDSKDYLQSKIFIDIVEFFRFQEKFAGELLSQNFYPSFQESVHKISWDRTHFIYLKNEFDPKFHSQRIQLGIPWPGFEFYEETQNPLDLGFSALLRKKTGCYPGQEVFEKTLSLSEPAKRLCIFQLQEKISISQNLELFYENKKVSSLSSYDEEQNLGLGIISKIFSTPHHSFTVQTTKTSIKKEVLFEY